MRPARIKLLIKSPLPRSQPPLSGSTCRFQAAWSPGREHWRTKAVNPLLVPVLVLQSPLSFPNPPALWPFKSPQRAILCMLSRVYRCIRWHQQGTVCLLHLTQNQNRAKDLSRWR